MAQLRDSLIAGDLRVTGTIYGITTSSMKLVTPRTINGTNFDGTANITTANWGTARNISISDSAGSNTGAAVSVNGSAAVTLKLPATIKASITGNASSATAFASNQTISLTGDITGSASSTGGWTISTAIGTGKVTNAMLAGSIANGKLANSSVVIAGKTLSLGGTLSADDLRGALGLSSAMHFLGITTTTMSDGLATAAVTIDGNSKTPAAGDVVIDNSSAYEYVWSGSKWERLGPDGSYSLSDHVHGNITNGGLLGTASVAVVTDANKKITTANLATSDPSASGSGITYIASISQNGQGKITATKSTVRDASASQSGVVSTGAQTFAGAKTFNGNIISSSSIYFGNNTESGKGILSYNATYPNYGIWYFDENTDVMTFSATNNANSKTNADLSINGQGDGTLSTRNRRIPHTNNTTGSVGSATVPVYVEGGAIKPITSYNGNAATATKVNKQLKLANSRAYDGSSEVTLLTNDLTPAVSKTYSGTTYYGTGDNDTSNAFYFLQVKPDSWYKSWTVHFKVRTTIPGQAANYDSTTWSMITGRANDVVYHNWNDRYDHAHYYIAVYRLNQTGFNAGYSHAIGVNIRYSSNYTNSAWYRKFELEYYKCEGCTVTVLDAPLLQANWPGNGTTNFSGVYNLDAINRGLRESSDDNTINQVQMDNNYMINSPNFRLPGYTIFGFSREGKSQGISLYSADYTGTTASINTARTYNNEGFDWTRDLQYLSSGSNFAKGADVNVSTKTSQSAVDIRYTDNNVSSAGTTLSLVPRKPVYLRGIIKEDGLFYLAPIDVTYNNATYKKVWTQDIPTSVETNGIYQYVYWLIGNPYYTYSYYVNLYDNNPIYWFHNGRFEEYTKANLPHEIRSSISGISYAYSGGGYHAGYNSLILRGNETYGSSGILFTSSKNTISINQTSDRAFIQYHPFGITTATAEGAAPTIATSGESGRLVIGIGNDSTDQIWLQSPTINGLIHQVGASSYVVPSLSATTTTANYPLISTTTAGLYTNNTSITMNGGTITATTFSGNLTGNVTGNVSGSSGSCTGNATTATALTSNAGSETQPIYFSGGKPVATTYALNATVNSGTVNQVAYYSSATAISSKAPAWEAWVAGTTAGPQAKIQIGNASYTSEAIPVASTSASGVVTTTVQAFTGDKTFTGAIIEDHNKIMINRVTSFSTSSTYAKDSFVWYNNKVWKCTTAITSAGAWTGSTNWSSAWSTDAKDTILNSGNYKVGILDDTIGLMPAANNWNSIGASNLFWYRSYITNYYGTTSFVTNWASGNNIGSPANSSSAATKGNVNFYNDCTKGGTQTKTNLTAGSAMSNITITLPSTAGTLVLTNGTGATGTWGISVTGSSGSCTGNAVTATAFSTSKEIKLTGDVTGSNSSTGGWSITTTISNSGVTAGSYGPSGNQTPTYGATFDVPYFTVNAQGRITAASTKTVKIPSADNTDTKNTAGSNQDTTKMFLIGAKSQTTGSNGVQTYSHTKVYATNGQLDADKVRVGEHVTLEYNSTSQCLNFSFA